MMHDIQNETDHRGIELDEVGIAGLRYPIQFGDGVVAQQGVADIDVTVRLPKERRGTHMSRMVALVHDHLTECDPRNLPSVLKTGAALLDAPQIALRLSLPVALPVAGPASGIESLQVHDVSIHATWTPDHATVETAVTSDVTSLCPCSKAISDYGAHNQRSRVSLTALGSDDDPYPLSVTSAVAIIRQAGSAPVVPLVKRPDERMLTMEAFDHPVFVEDMARDIAADCEGRGLRYKVRIRNLESIHSHDAVATLSRMA